MFSYMIIWENVKLACRHLKRNLIKGMYILLIFTVAGFIKKLTSKLWM